jgi:hypothetical protein
MRKAWFTTLFALVVLAVILFGFRLPGVWPVTVVAVVMCMMSAGAELIHGAKTAKR